MELSATTTTPSDGMRGHASRAAIIQGSLQEGGIRLLSIGEFARASRLSAKALRLYDELGLLSPAQVDPDSGYRFYEPAQLERARLVAWLRRLGMPLARIRVVCDAPSPAAAAAEVAAFWAQAESDLASRRDLAAFLVSHLSRKDTAMPAPDTGLTIRYAAASDTGLSRPANQDSAYASPRLLAVADGRAAPGTGPAPPPSRRSSRWKPRPPAPGTC